MEFINRDSVQHIEQQSMCETQAAVTQQEESAVSAPVWSVDPRTGKQREQVAVEATAEEVDQTVRAAHAARAALADRTVRAAFLRTAAEFLEGAKEQLVEAADAETALGPVRLTG